MYFAIICKDRPDALALRARTRPDHLAYLDPFRDSILFAGPFLESGTDNSVGGLIVIDLPDLAAARAFAEGDPYAVAGLFETIEVMPWRKVIPA
ncbi:MAG TPA: YciI family protein [Aquamicrobium sp.]|jgi:uncharacterized protein YciI|nr:YciI family protein [Aquamicrobium sp.]